MEQKSNVLIWVHDFPAVSETFIRNHIVGLLDKGWNVHVYTKHKHPKQMQALQGFEEYDLYSKCISNDDLLERNKLKRLFRTFGILLSKFGRKGFLKYAKTLNVFRYGKQSLNLQNFYVLHYLNQKNIEVVHAHYGFMGNEAVFLKEIGASVRLFTTFHGVDIREGLKPEKKGIYTKLFATTDRLISISKYNTESLLKMGAPEAKLISLPNGIDTQYFTPNETKERLGIHILTVGRFMKVKGQDIAIKAFAEVLDAWTAEDITLHFIGDGPLMDSSLQLAKELGLDENIVFHGWQSSAEIRNQYQNADFYLLPSRGEALPTVLLESQSCGLPIVATDVGSVRDMLPSNNVVVEAESIDALAQGILAMLTRKESWREIGSGNRDHVVAHFDAGRILEKLITLYHQPNTKG